MKEGDGLCIHCKSPETVKHIMFDCKKYNKQIKDLHTKIDNVYKYFEQHEQMAEYINTNSDTNSIIFESKDNESENESNYSNSPSNNYDLNTFFDLNELDDQDQLLNSFLFPYHWLSIFILNEINKYDSLLDLRLQIIKHVVDFYDDILSIRNEAIKN